MHIQEFVTAELNFFSANNPIEKFFECVWYSNENFNGYVGLQAT